MLRTHVFYYWQHFFVIWGFASMRKKKHIKSPLKGDHFKRKCLHSKFQSSIFRGYVRGVWFLICDWSTCWSNESPSLDQNAGDVHQLRPQKRRGSAWTVFIADFVSLDRHLHQQGWMVAQVVPAERWMRNPLDQFVSVYELEWRFHSMPFIFDGNPPSKNELLMSICSDCAGSNVSIHSMVLASYLPCTACHFVATHTQTLSSLPLKPCWVFWPKNETAFKKHEEIFLKATCNSSTHFSQPSNRLVYPQ